jgi:hypothetical protein
METNITLKKTQSSYTSLEVSKGLKKLGIAQHATAFYDRTEFISSELIDFMSREGMKMSTTEELFAAFTSDQLIAALGAVACGIEMNDEKYIKRIHYSDPYDGMITRSGDSLPDLLGWLLIDLIQGRKKPLEEANRWLVNF